MNADEKVIVEEVNPKGWHRVEIIRFGREVEVDAWVDLMIPDYAQETWCYHPWIEGEKEKLNLHHTNLFWRERGAVDFSRIEGAPLLYGILWWIAPGERVSFSADVAATLHLQRYGKMPSHAWMRKAPAGHHQINAGEGVNQTVLNLESADWVPAGFVVVGNQRMES